MSVWKYIYIKFYQFRRWLLGKTLGEDFAAMLFVVFLDMFLYLGILILIDRLVDNVLLKKCEPFFLTLYALGTLTIGWLRNRSMCKGDAFERIRKEVEAEPHKMLWGILSILYIIFVVLFFLFCCYVGKNGLRFLEPL